MKYRIRKDLSILPSHGRPLYRIERISSGELGGYIEDEHNLSQEGNCWIYEDAHVYLDAKVSGNARIFGNAKIHGNVMVYGNSQVCGFANIWGNAKIYGNAFVHRKVWICGNSEITGEISSGIWKDKNCYGIDVWL